MNLGFKLAVVAGFATVLGFRGGGGPDRVVAGSETRAIPTTPPGTYAGAHRADSQTATAEVVAPVGAPPQSGSVGPPPEAPPDDGVLSAVAPESTRNEAASSFAAEVLRLSSEADEMDRLWHAYKIKCGVRVGRQYAFGREWFSVFDRAAEQTIDGPGCDEAHRRLRHDGETLGRAIQKARTTARQAFLDRGTENGMLRWHALHWPQFDDEDDKPRRRDQQKASSAPARSTDPRPALPRREASAGPP